MSAADDVEAVKQAALQAWHEERANGPLRHYRWSKQEEEAAMVFFCSGFAHGNLFGLNTMAHEIRKTLRKDIPE